MPLVTSSTARRLAGRASWAVSLVPALRSFIGALWTVADEMRGGAMKGGEARENTGDIPLPGGGAHGWGEVDPWVAPLDTRARWRGKIGAGELGRATDVCTRIMADASP